MVFRLTTIAFWLRQLGRASDGAQSAIFLRQMRRTAYSRYVKWSPRFAKWFGGVPQHPVRETGQAVLA
jgi:hypothetical protein